MLRLGEVGLNAIVGRAPALTNGESSSAPAGGSALSVAVAAPAANPLAVALPTAPKVITISPRSR